MRILYGVCGDGMGHAVRSSVVVAHLLSRGHEVEVLASSERARDYLRRAAIPAERVVGLGAVYRDNALLPLETLLANVARAVASPAWNVPAFARLAKRPPDAAVVDFEAWTAYAANRLGVPLLSLDNIHFDARCEHAPEIARPEDERARKITRLATNRLVPRARHYFVTTFARPLSMRPRTSLHLPVLRPEVLALRGAPREAGDHLVCYFNAKTDLEPVVAALGASGVPVLLYTDSDEPVWVPLRENEAGQLVGNVEVRRFSDREFLEDVACSRAVVGGAGFTFMTEAMWLGKPVLAVPFEGQYEQILNASYAEHLGRGRRCDRLTPEAVRAFYDEAPRLAEDLRGLEHDGNTELLGALEAHLYAIERGQAPETRRWA